MNSTIKSSLGEFEREGDGWTCYLEFDSRQDIALHVDDSEGPDPGQLACLENLIPQLPLYEAKCRDLLECLDGHDLSGIFFKCDCDFMLSFNWGNGEWGRSIFVKMKSGNILSFDIVED